MKTWSKATVTIRLVQVRWTCHHCQGKNVWSMNFIPQKSKYLLGCEFCNRMTYIDVPRPEGWPKPMKTTKTGNRPPKIPGKKSPLFPFAKKPNPR